MAGLHGCPAHGGDFSFHAGSRRHSQWFPPCLLRQSLRVCWLPVPDPVRATQRTEAQARLSGVSVLRSPRWLEQLDSPQHRTGTLRGCCCLWRNPSPPCTSVPKCGGPHQLQGVPDPHPASSGTPQPALMGGTPAHHTASPGAVRGAASSGPPPHFQQGSFHYCSNLSHILPAPKNSQPVPWQAFCSRLWVGALCS